MATDRLTGLDTAFLCMDQPTAPMNMGGVAVFAPPQPVHPTRIVELLLARAERIPQLRQRLRTSWLPFGSACWEDDPGFVVNRHVYAHRLGTPRYHGQLAARVATIMAEPLDTTRPPWQLHLITGLAGGRFAIVAKLHHALADGASATMLALGLLDGAAEQAPPSPAARPAEQRTPWPLGQPVRMLTEAASAAGGLPERLRRTGEVVDIASAVARNARRAPSSPLLAPPSGRRRITTLRVELEHIRRIRRQHGGTTNDVLLATLAGALRQWLGERGHRVDTLPVRAFVPVSRRPNPHDAQCAGNRLSGYLCDLPIGEPDPLRRLHTIRGTMDANKRAGDRCGAGAIPVLAETLPAAVHRLATPLLGRHAALLFDTVVTNVPLPNMPLYFDGAELREIYPLVPLAYGHGLAVAFCTYRDIVHIGLHADAATLPDVDRLGEVIPDTVNAMWEPPAVPLSQRPVRPVRRLASRQPVRRGA
ncbi:MAG: wax ester/triacylglycerol synthase family O-acyltransferase [Sciscionella sp.]